MICFRWTDAGPEDVEITDYPRSPVKAYRPKTALPASWDAAARNWWTAEVRRAVGVRADVAIADRGMRILSAPGASQRRPGHEQARITDHDAGRSALPRLLAWILLVHHERPAATPHHDRARTRLQTSQRIPDLHNALPLLSQRTCKPLPLPGHSRPAGRARDTSGLAVVAGHSHSCGRYMLSRSGGQNVHAAD